MNSQILKQNLAETYANLLNKLEPVSEADFYKRMEDKWSIAENLAHLTLSAKLFDRALQAPKAGLLLKFGPHFKAFRDENWLDSTYRTATFPERTGFEPRMSQASTKAYETDQFKQKHEQLIKHLALWKEWQLDRLRLPHPIYTHLSLREYVVFMAYHIRHHEKAINRILGME